MKQEVSHWTGTGKIQEDRQLQFGEALSKLFPPTNSLSFLTASLYLFSDMLCITFPWCSKSYLSFGTLLGNSINHLFLFWQKCSSRPIPKPLSYELTGILPFCGPFSISSFRLILLGYLARYPASLNSFTICSSSYSKSRPRPNHSMNKLLLSLSHPFSPFSDTILFGSLWGYLGRGLIRGWALGR